MVVDEIQRLPDLLDDVRRFLAERRLRFALLASSARRLEPAAARLPAGRVERRTMLTLVPEELGAQARQTRVDFLLRRGRELLALAVSYGERPRRKALAGLRAIGALAGVARRVLVYRGSEERKTRDGIEVWPLRRFLGALEGGRLWPGDP